MFGVRTYRVVLDTYNLIDISIDFVNIGDRNFLVGGLVVSQCVCRIQPQIFVGPV